MNKKVSISILGKETDKVVAEVIKAAVGGVAEPLGDLSRDLIGGLLGDRAKQWRVRNFIDSAEKTAVHIERKGIRLADARVLPMGEVYALFEGMSKTEHSQVQELYAKLLANALDPNSEIKAEKIFTSLLQQLTPSEVAVLEILQFSETKYEEFHQSVSELQNVDISSLSTDKQIVAHRELSDQRMELEKLKDKAIDRRYAQLGLENDAANEQSLQNLCRLGCIVINVPDIVQQNFENLISGFQVTNQVRGTRMPVLDAGKTMQMLADLTERVRILNGEKSSNEALNSLRVESRFGKSFSHRFTPFGQRFMEACSID